MLRRIGREQMPDLRIFGTRSLCGAQNIAKRAWLGILLNTGRNIGFCGMSSRL
jgi:hypothetical protein